MTSAGRQTLRRWPEPLVEWRAGPLVARLLPAGHPTADLEKAIALVGALAIAGMLLLPLDSLAPLLGGCHFRGLTGIPCMTCGATRAVLALWRGDLLVSLQVNPLLGGLLLGGLAYTPVSWILWLGRLPRPRLAPAGRRAKWILAGLVAAAVLLNWAYLVVESS